MLNLHLLYTLEITYSVQSRIVIYIKYYYSVSYMASLLHSLSSRPIIVYYSLYCTSPSIHNGML
ncbi:hypothetical protein D1T48_gp29 [Thermoproteus tenax virus 1]|uniref:Uncharacterized 7.3 kDa protein n=1 Tax=Thermoproteus tenax virus 1 (strain KRA1) TaxID=10480 RepID=YORQ_TTV1K|nr:hypothetical protein D1T48_gp29 [Thermoproteus tenax virus 1]P19301.1 RecName: Full=Uncharacterized 7.3 kDa protein [Thermoproteus tenax virus 1 (STRAIN KRA1)]CAA32997.1 unnamed protein product [Thermoproteus tenax virus 1]